VAEGTGFSRCVGENTDFCVDILAVSRHCIFHLIIQKGGKEMAAKIDEETCTACGACAEVCPVDAISVDESAKVDAELCSECGACVDECPVEAISLEE
jgi:ferredoxin